MSPSCELFQGTMHQRLRRLVVAQDRHARHLHVAFGLRFRLLAARRLSVLRVACAVGTRSLLVRRDLLRRGCAFDRVVGCDTAETSSSGMQKMIGETCVLLAGWPGRADRRSTSPRCCHPAPPAGKPRSCPGRRCRSARYRSQRIARFSRAKWNSGATVERLLVARPRRREIALPAIEHAELVVRDRVARD